MRDPFVKAAIAQYEQSFTYPLWDDGERAAVRSAVRGMLVRMGRYDEFLIEYAIPKEQSEARDAVS